MSALSGVLFDDVDDGCQLLDSLGCHGDEDDIDQCSTSGLSSSSYHYSTGLAITCTGKKSYPCHHSRC